MTQSAGHLNPSNLRIEGGETSATQSHASRVEGEAQSNVETARGATFATYQSGLTFSGLDWSAPVTFHAILEDDASHVCWRTEAFLGECVWSSGRFQFRGRLPASPFTFDFDLWGAADEETSSIRFHFDLDTWRGQRISQLAFFDDIAELAAGIHLGQSLLLDCWGNFGRVVSARPRSDCTAFFERVRLMLVPFGRAREVTRAIGVDPALGGPLTDDQLSEVNLLHALSYGTEYRERASKLRLSMRLGLNGIRALLADPTGNASGTVRLHQEQHEFSFLGARVVARDVTFELTHAVLESKVEELRRLLQVAPEAGIDVSYIGAEGAELVIRAESLAAIPERQSVLELLRAAPGGRMFKNGKDVKEYLDQEHDAWER